MKSNLKKLLKPTIHPINWKAFFITHLLFFCIGLFLFKSLQYVTNEANAFKETAIRDIDFSDLYYQTQQTSKINDSIIIINSGSIKNDSIFGRRNGMLKLINRLTTSNSFSPKKIGVDLEYVAPKNQKIDSMLGQAFTDQRIVIAESKQYPTIFKGIQTAYVNFPSQENSAVRNYYYSFEITPGKLANSFAAACLDTSFSASNADKEFYLKYYCKGKGFHNVLDRKNEEDAIFSFPAIEASTILADSPHLDLEKLFHNKIVLIGHLGEGDMHNPDDITDKHKSPTDFQFIFKTQIMPGVVVHANAIRQLQLKDQIYDCPPIGYLIIIYILSIYFLAVSLLIDRLKSIFLRLAVELSFSIASVIVIHFLLFKQLSLALHVNTFYIAVALVALAELKSPFMEYYERKSKTKTAHKS